MTKVNVLKMVDEIDNISQKINLERCGEFPLPKRRLRLLETAYLSDCSFIVGEEPDESEIDLSTNSDGSAKTKLFHCHKLFLATASEVFDRMFYGNFIDQPNPIKVVDIEPKIFEIFLEYIYINEVAASNVKKENIEKLMYIGKKYLMNDFIDKCIEKLQQNPWPLQNTLPVFEAALLHNNLSLMMVCFEKMKRDHNLLLSQKTFYDLNINNIKRLCVLLKQLPVNILNPNKIISALATYAKMNNLHTNKHSEEFIILVEAVYTVNPKHSDVSSYTFERDYYTGFSIFGYELINV